MKPKLKTLPSGLRVIAVPMKDNPTATVLVLVEAGSKYETKKINGLSHFLEHMCFKGTEKRPKGLDIARELDGLGADSNAFTSQEYTGYWAKGRAKNVDRLLDVVADVYLNSTLPTEEIEKEKGVIIDEINMYEDMPMRKVHYTFGELLYGDQPAGWTILGPKENIRAMTREDFLKYRKEHYVAKGTVVVVAGDIKPMQVFKQVNKLFENIPTGRKHPKKKVVEKQSRPQTLVEYKQTDQTHLILGFRSFHAKHKDIRAIDMLVAVLGKGMSSRLFDRLREQMGVGYYVRAYNDDATDTGVVEVNTGVSNERVQEVVEAILEECKRMKTELVSPAELKKTKEYVIGNLELQMESTNDVAMAYGYQSIVYRELKTPKQLIKEIRAVTAEDIQRVAKKIFTNDRLNLALIGPFKSEKSFAKILKI